MALHNCRDTLTFSKFTSRMVFLQSNLFFERIRYCSLKVFSRLPFSKHCPAKPGKFVAARWSIDMKRTQTGRFAGRRPFVIKFLWMFRLSSSLISYWCQGRRIPNPRSEWSWLIFSKQGPASNGNFFKRNKQTKIQKTKIQKNAKKIGDCGCRNNMKRSCRPQWSWHSSWCWTMDVVWVALPHICACQRIYLGQKIQMSRAKVSHDISMTVQS